MYNTPVLGKGIYIRGREVFKFPSDVLHYNPPVCVINCIQLNTHVVLRGATNYGGYLIFYTTGGKCRPLYCVARRSLSSTTGTPLKAHNNKKKVVNKLRMYGLKHRRVGHSVVYSFRMFYCCFVNVST